jgi:hypothetical protein
MKEGIRVKTKLWQLTAVTLAGWYLMIQTKGSNEKLSSWLTLQVYDSALECNVACNRLHDRVR